MKGTPTTPHIDKFTGLEGPARAWTAIGLMGGIFMLLVYLVTVSAPNAQQKIHDMMAEERKAHQHERAFLLDVVKDGQRREASRDEDFRTLARELAKYADQMSRLSTLLERIIEKKGDAE